MTIGANINNLENKIRWELNNVKDDLGDKTIRAIASAVAKAIEENNRALERDIR